MVSCDLSLVRKLQFSSDVAKLSCCMIFYPFGAHWAAEDDLTLSTSLFGYLMLTRGIGNILSTPISTSLLRNNGSSSSPPYHHDNTGFAVGEGRFENMIIYVGACFSAAAMVVVVGWGMERARARARRT